MLEHKCFWYFSWVEKRTEQDIGAQLGSEEGSSTKARGYPVTSHQLDTSLILRFKTRYIEHRLVGRGLAVPNNLGDVFTHRSSPWGNLSLILHTMPCPSCYGVGMCGHSTRYLSSAHFPRYSSAGSASAHCWCGWSAYGYGDHSVAASTPSGKKVSGQKLY